MCLKKATGLVPPHLPHPRRPRPHLPLRQNLHRLQSPLPTYQCIIVVIAWFGSVQEQPNPWR